MRHFGEYLIEIARMTSALQAFFKGQAWRSPYGIFNLIVARLMAGFPSQISGISWVKIFYFALILSL